MNYIYYVSYLHSSLFNRRIGTAIVRCNSPIDSEEGIFFLKKGIRQQIKNPQADITVIAFSLMKEESSDE